MADGEVARPNIRIEIHNNLMEAMDVDDSAAKLSDGEEGEIIEESVNFDDIIDEKITYPTRPTSDQQKKAWAGVASKGFTTGINIFDKGEQVKRSERAKRFQLDAEEATNFTTENLESLHVSLGITADNEKEICFDTLHLHGIDTMSSHDIMEYFTKYAPVAVEWLDETSCNVLYSDDVSSARALFYLSKSIKDMPVDGSNENETGKSILLKNNNTEMQDEDDHDVSVSDIKIPIPAGYWRLGASHSKSKYILIRFAKVTDRKILASEHYKNPNNGGMRGGLISESKKAQFRGIFERNREINTKNPWGDLARSWSRDKKTEEVVEAVPASQSQATSHLKHRLGFKRSQEAAFEGQEEKPVEKPKVPRMRMYADEEEAKIKRKKALEAMKRVANPPKVEAKPVASDLRNMIRRRDVRADEDDDEEDEAPTVPRCEVDLGNRLMNRRLKFTNPPPLSVQQRSGTDIADVRQRIDNNKLTKQHRFREELLRNKRLKSPPPPQRPPRNTTPRYSHRSDDDDGEIYSDEDVDDMKTGSKVAVVVKKQKQPTVASTVWSRVHTTAAAAAKGPSVKERLQMPGRTRKDSTASSDDSSSTSSDDDSSSNEDESMNVGGGKLSDEEEKIKPSILARPGFRSDLLAEHKVEEHKSPLRIEINNDHYKQ